MHQNLSRFFIVLVLVFLLLAQAFFIVDQREQAIVLQFGQPIGDKADASTYIKGPGLHFKIPFIQNVQYFDRRVLSVDPPPDQVVISSRNTVSSQDESALNQADGQLSSDLYSNDSIRDVTGEPIILDTFARYKIIDPLQFLKTLRTIDGANSRLESILQNSTKAALGKTSLRELLSQKRVRVMADIQNRVNEVVKRDRMGIEIVDVRIVRADLTPELRQSTVTRMKSELKERATETRAKGEELALEISSTAEKERTVLLAEAQRDAEILKGTGDREAIKTYANAFNKDKEFYAFIRSMEAYKKTLANPETQLILSPNSDFFHYFQNTGR